MTRRLPAIVALAFAVPCLCGPAVAETSAARKDRKAEQEILKLENEWLAATLTRDAAAIERLLADDYTLGEFDGTVTTKAQLLEYIKSGEFAATSLVYDGVTVRVYGDTAIATGRTTERSQWKGSDSSGLYQWTDTWINRAGHWQCVAGHASKVVQK